MVVPFFRAVMSGAWLKTLCIRLKILPLAAYWYNTMSTLNLCDVKIKVETVGLQMFPFYLNAFPTVHNGSNRIKSNLSIL